MGYNFAFMEIKVSILYPACQAHSIACLGSQGMLMAVLLLSWPRVFSSSNAADRLQLVHQMNTARMAA